MYILLDQLAFKVIIRSESLVISDRTGVHLCRFELSPRYELHISEAAMNKATTLTSRSLACSAWPLAFATEGVRTQDSIATVRPQLPHYFRHYRSELVSRAWGSIPCRDASLVTSRFCSFFLIEQPWSNGARICDLGARTRVPTARWTQLGYRRARGG